MIVLTSKGSFAAEFMKHYPAEVVSIRDLGEKDFWDKIKKAKKIIHNASSIGCVGLNDCVSRNFDFSRKLIDFMADNNPKVNFTYISSMSILNSSSDKAFGDPREMTPYAFSKYLAECYCAKSKITNLKNVRFSTLFYKDPEKDGLSKLIYDAVTKKEIIIYDGGEAKRDFIPLNIAVDYVKRVAAVDVANCEDFNIVSGNETSFKDIAEYLKEVVPGLRVLDLKSKVSFPSVLSHFHNDSIKRLGKIDFNLKEEIKVYIKEINAL